MAKINNVEYSWSMIQLQTNLNGESPDKPLFVAATAVSWKADRKMENVYGLGGQPRGRGFGNVTYEGQIELPYSTQVYLRSQSTNGTLLGLGEFNLIVSWVNDLAQSVTQETVTLMGCVLTQAGMNAKQDDTSIVETYDLHPYRITNSKNSKFTGRTAWSYEMCAV